MKRIHFFYLIFLVLFSCDQEERPQMSYQTVLIDLTSDSISYTDYDFQRHGVIDNNYDGCCLILSYITDIASQKRSQVCLDTLTPSLSENMIERKRQLRLYNAERDSLFSEINHTPKGRVESHIFEAIITELGMLSQYPKEANRRLIVLSDLFENNAFYSYYNKQDQNRLSNLPLLATRFEGQYSVPDNLEGIVLEIHYEPTRLDQYDHKHFVDFYRLILEPKGVHILTEHTNTINIE